MTWVYVNFLSNQDVETFFVNEEEEKNKKKKNIWLQILGYTIPVLRLLSYIK